MRCQSLSIETNDELTQLIMRCRRLVSQGTWQNEPRKPSMPEHVVIAQHVGSGSPLPPEYRELSDVHKALEQIWDPVVQCPPFARPPRRWTQDQCETLASVSTSRR